MVLCVCAQAKRQKQGKAVGPPIEYCVRNKQLVGSVFSGAVIKLSSTTERRTMEVRLATCRTSPYSDKCQQSHKARCATFRTCTVTPLQQNVAVHLWTLEL